MCKRKGKGTVENVTHGDLASSYLYTLKSNQASVRNSESKAGEDSCVNQKGQSDLGHIEMRGKLGVCVCDISSERNTIQLFQLA